jgi:hypothetical protein
MRIATIGTAAMAMGALLLADLAWAAPPKPVPPPAVAAPKVVPSELAVTVSPNRIVKANVRATAMLYAASTFDEMNLFDVVDRIVDDVQSARVRITSKPTRVLLDAYANARPERVTKANRQELTRFASELVQSVFGQIVTDSVKQMEAYAALVRDVAASVEQFTRDNTSQNQDRDSLADRYPEDTFKPATELALSLSQHGYGAAQLAASKLAEQIREASAILADPAILSAYGVKGHWDLVEKLGGKSAAEAERIAQRAEAGSRLLGFLADSAELLDTPKQALAELARRLAAAAPSAKAWLAVKPRPFPKVPPKLVRPLCFDEKRSLVPCTVAKS